MVNCWSEEDRYEKTDVRRQISHVGDDQLSEDDRWFHLNGKKSGMISWELQHLREIFQSYFGIFLVRGGMIWENNAMHTVSNICKSVETEIVSIPCCQGKTVMAAFPLLKMVIQKPT